MFTQKKLLHLIWPLIVEQILAVTVGMVDIVMISSVGEAAVSGVSLVDSISILLINIFSALATGGAVVASQYLGRNNHEQANFAAKQLVLSVLICSIMISSCFLVFGNQILTMIFPNVEAIVSSSARVYLFYSSLSYPFIALFNSGAALYRAMGNSRISMMNSLIMNGMNIVGNAILIYGFHMGVAGAAISTLFARFFCSILILTSLHRSKGEIQIDSYLKLGFDQKMIQRILAIGIPNGLENGMFQIGKILVQGIIAGFGTVSIAANAVANNFAGMEIIPAASIGLAMITVVGQCVGAQEFEQARAYTKKLMKWAYLASIILNVVILLAADQILVLYGLSQETSSLAKQLLLIHGIFTMVSWPLAFTLPNALRAAGDAKFTMSVSIFTMWLCRIGLSFVFAIFLNLGVVGVWIAMVCDWFVRGTIFVIRFRGVKWLQKKLI